VTYLALIKVIGLIIASTLTNKVLEEFLPGLEKETTLNARISQEYKYLKPGYSGS
jgi:hypothetical protein